MWIIGKPVSVSLASIISTHSNVGQQQGRNAKIELTSSLKPFLRLVVSDQTQTTLKNEMTQGI